MGKKSNIIQQKDHIILPRATLMRFADDKTKRITCLKLSNPDKIMITRPFPKSFHTRPNFYNPEFDDIVKQYETLIGKWYKTIMDAIKTNNESNIDRLKLKKDIIEFITIQFNRAVLSNEILLNKYIEQKKNRYDKLSAHYFKTGSITNNFLNNKQKLFSEDIEQSRYSCQNILGQPNEEINKIYKDFKLYILHIPDKIKSTFLMSPMHFVANDQFARVILSPRLAVALYNVELPQLIMNLAKEDVDCLVVRAIESALSMSEEYQEVIGEEEYLKCIKRKLEKYKSKIIKLEKEQIILISGNDVILKDNETIHEAIVSMMCFEPKCKKIIIEIGTISKELLELDKYNNGEGLYMFKKYEYEIVLISKHYFNNLSSKIQIVKTKEEAIKLFS